MRKLLECLNLGVWAVVLGGIGMLAFLQMTGDFEAPASLKLVLGAGFIVNGLFTLVLAGTKGGDEDN